MQNWGPNSIQGFTQATQEGPSMMSHKFSSEYNNLEFCIQVNYFTTFCKFLSIFQKFCDSIITFPYKFTKDSLNL